MNEEFDVTFGMAVFPYIHNGSNYKFDIQPAPAGSVMRRCPNIDKLKPPRHDRASKP